MKTPEKVVATVLGMLGVLTFAFPVLCLPSSIAAIVLATRGIRWERDNAARASTWLQVVRVAAILAIFVTTVLMVSAFPAAWERNFG